MPHHSGLLLTLQTSTLTTVKPPPHKGGFLYLCINNEFCIEKIDIPSYPMLSHIYPHMIMGVFKGTLDIPMYQFLWMFEQNIMCGGFCGIIPINNN